MVSLPFTISPDYTILVKKDDRVKVGQTLAKRLVSNDLPLSLADALSVEPRQSHKYVKVRPGDSVKNGDVLAVKKSFFSEVKVISEVSGTILSFERDRGVLHIKPEGEGRGDKEEKLASPIDGIVSVCNNGQIVIDTDKDVLLAEQGVGGKAEAGLFVVSLPPDAKLESLVFALDTKCIGKIVLLETVEREALLKAIGMGAEGIITKNISENDLEYLSRRNIPTPVVSVSDEAWKKLVRWNGKQAYLDGVGKTILLLHI